MGDKAALRRRLAFYKAVLCGVSRPAAMDRAPRKAKFQNGVDPLYLRNVLKVDPQSLEKCAQFFELDHTHPNDLTVLAHLLADIVFGTRTPGRKKGDRPVWYDDRLVELAFNYHKLKSRHPDWNDTQIAKRISQSPSFFEFRDRYEPIRQRLSKVKNMKLDWSLKDAFDYYGLDDED